MILETTSLRVDVDPQAGAAIRSIQSRRNGEWVEWLACDALAKQINVAPCFAMLPFVNRIPHGRLAAAPECVLSANREDLSVHPIHGYAWLKPWLIAEEQQSSLSLRYEGSRDPWPWCYSTELSIALKPDELCIRLSVYNEDHRPMPAALGLHPAFPTEDLQHVCAATESFLHVDESALPLRLERDQAYCEDLAIGTLPPQGMDNDFGGWNGKAVLNWSDRRLEINADQSFDALHVFRAPGAPVICVEPATQLSAAMGLASPIGVSPKPLLEPGDTLAGEIRLLLTHLAG